MPKQPHTRSYYVTLHADHDTTILKFYSIISTLHLVCEDIPKHPGVTQLYSTQFPHEVSTRVTIETRARMNGRPVARRLKYIMSSENNGTTRDVMILALVHMNNHL